MYKVFLFLLKKILNKKYVEEIYIKKFLIKKTINWIKRLILPKTWTKIDVDMHHFDYSSLFLCSLLDDSKVIYIKKIFLKIF